MTKKTILIGHWGGPLLDYVERIKEEFREMGKVKKRYEARARLRRRGLHVTCKKREV